MLAESIRIRAERGMSAVMAKAAASAAIDNELSEGRDGTLVRRDRKPLLRTRDLSAG